MNTITDMNLNSSRFGFLHMEKHYIASKLQTVKWFGTYDEQSDTYSDLCAEAVYNWTGNTCDSITVREFEIDGVTESSSYTIELDESGNNSDKKQFHRNVKRPESYVQASVDIIGG